MNQPQRSEVAARPLLIRFAPLVVLVTLLVASGAWLYASRQAPQYTASARVLVEPVTLPTAAIRPPDMPNEQLVATSNVVLARAAHALSESTATVSSATSVNSPTGTTVLVVEYTAPTPAAARAGADAVARAYTVYRDARTAPAKSTVVRLDAPKVSVRVITAATEPGSPSSPDVLILVGAAVFVGVALGVLLTVALARQDLRVRTAVRWQEVSGRPILAALGRREVVPDDPAGVQDDPTGRDLATTSPVAAGLLDAARFRIGRELPARGGVVLVVRTREMAGAIAVGRELAAAFARSGRESVHLEVGSGTADDRHRVRIHTGRRSERRGADERTLTGVEIGDVVRATGKDRIAVVTVPVSASGALALDLVAATDAVVIVDDLRTARSRGIERTVHDIESAGAAWIGGVLLGLRSRRGSGRVPAHLRAPVRPSPRPGPHPGPGRAPGTPSDAEEPTTSDRPGSTEVGPVASLERRPAVRDERETITTGGKAS